MKKVINWDDMQGIRERKLVLAAGVYDILTVAHIRHLEWGAKQGDVLIVGLTPDDKVNKGAQRPCFKLKHRIAQLSALTFVDHIIVNRHFDYCSMIQELKPDFYLKGPDVRRKPTESLEREMDVVIGYGGKVIFSPDKFEFHTTEVLKQYEVEELRGVQE